MHARRPQPFTHRPPGQSNRARQASSSTTQLRSQFTPSSSEQNSEHRAFQQHKYEAFGLQQKQTRGTITPPEQARLGVLQAKMNGFWDQKRAQVPQPTPDLDHIPVQPKRQSTPSPPSRSATQLAPGNVAGAKHRSQRSTPNALPTHLKTGIETLSGLSMDNVRVHYNSPKPAQLQANAYTQGSEIHLGPGQEHHLPHEAWHVVQQKQGRVQPTQQLNGVHINDQQGLEQEADRRGRRAERVGQRAQAHPTSP